MWVCTNDSADMWDVSDNYKWNYVFPFYFNETNISVPASWLVPEKRRTHPLFDEWGETLQPAPHMDRHYHVAAINKQHKDLVRSCLLVQQCCHKCTLNFSQLVIINLFCVGFENSSGICLMIAKEKRNVFRKVENLMITNEKEYIFRKVGKFIYFQLKSNVSRSEWWLTLTLLMSYIYGAPILDVSRSHTTTHHSR